MTTLRTITLVGADGTRHVLACQPGEPYEARPNTGIWGVGPKAITSRSFASLPGSRIDQVRATARLVPLPVLVSGADELELDERIAALGAILAPDIDCRVIVERTDGTQREIVLRYSSGAEAIAAHENDDAWAAVVPLLFVAHYPRWRALDDAAQLVAGTFADATGAGSNPLEITNDGDVAVWPEFIIRGPAQNVHGVSLESGQVWRIQEEIEGGQTVRIDTNPASRGVFLNDAQAWRTLVDETSEWWPLLPRLNRLILRANSINSSIGSFEVRWRTEYDTC